METKVEDITIMSVVEYNEIQSIRFSDDMEKCELGDPMPYYPMYIFMTRYNQPRKIGYVRVKGESHKFARTKKELAYG